MIEFSIIDEADQQFATVLNNRRVTFRVRYNKWSDRWSFDLALDDEWVLYGRRIEMGVDLLAPFDLGLGILFATYTGTDYVDPNRANLPAGLIKLYHTTEEEIEATFPNSTIYNSAVMSFATAVEGSLI